MPNDGYSFLNWTLNGNIVSTSANYTFTINANVSLVANFSAPLYTVAVSASPSAGGIVVGGGRFAAGSTQKVSATPNNGYTFVNWTQNGSVVSTATSYSFTLTANTTLVANFTVGCFPIHSRRQRLAQRGWDSHWEWHICRGEHADGVCHGQ